MYYNISDRFTFLGCGWQRGLSRRRDGGAHIRPLGISFSWKSRQQCASDRNEQRIQTARPLREACDDRC